MSRRRINLNWSFDILPLIKEKKEMVRAMGDTRVTQSYYDLEEAMLYDLSGKVASRDRFKDAVKLVERIKEIDTDKQGELRHIYVIEGSNRQDLAAASCYICTELEQCGFIEASKIIIIPQYHLFENQEGGFSVNGGMTMGALKLTRRDGGEDEEEPNPWNESSEAIGTFLGEACFLPDPGVFNSIEQYPIFLMIDGSQNNLGGMMPQPDSPGLKKRDVRFEYIASGAFWIRVEAFEAKEFIKLLRAYLEDKGYSISRGVRLEEFVRTMGKRKKSLSEMDVKLVGDALVLNHLTRCGRDNVLTQGDFDCFSEGDEKKEKNTSNPYEKLNNIIGLQSIKGQIHEMITRLKFDKQRRELSLPVSQIGFNAVFLGSPGTAKTTTARIIAEMLKFEGFLESSAFREVKKSDIVGRYVGWTAALVDEMFSSLSEKGGVIFFDEIYTLSEEDSTAFDKEAITAIVQNMENHRNVFCIFAGYPGKMQRFLSGNPGLRSRISFTFSFEDYSGSELADIFEGYARQNSYVLPEGSRELVGSYFEELKRLRGDNFGNGREARTLFEISTVKMASRVSQSPGAGRKELMEIRLSDMERAIESIINSEAFGEKNHENKREIGFRI